MADAKLAPLLRELYPFRHLKDDDVAKICALATLVNLAKNEVLHIEGTEEVNFYLLVSGKLQLSEVSRRSGVKPPRLIRPGEFFGADYQLYRVVRAYEAKATAASQLISLSPDLIRQVIREIPAVRTGLLDMLDLEHELSSSHMKWLGEDELVRLMVRHNATFLWISLAGPALALILGLLVLGFGLAVSVAALRIAITILAGGWSLVAFLWLIWNYVDWANDHYVVTDQRVVWLEQVVGLYESRREALLSAIKTSEVKTTQLGRILGYGDLTIYAFMGQITFHNISDPDQVKILIDRLQKQASQKIQREDTRAMERIIRRKIDPPPPTPAAPPKPAAAPAKPARRLPTLAEVAEFFSLKLRIEAGDTITYRKHWLLLFAKLWLPTLALMGVIFGTGWLVWARLNNNPGLPTPLTSVVMGIFLALFPIAAWFYVFIDWRNDIYQLTNDKLIDSERKPLGDELTRSAPLGNIQNMDYQRIGLIGILFNFGTVTINTGADSKLTFDFISDPARAQQDIFNRLYNMQRKKQLNESTKQWEQVSDWLAAYHRQAEDLRKSQTKE